MKLFRRSGKRQKSSECVLRPRATRTALAQGASLPTAAAIERMLRVSNHDIQTGRYRTLLYRFLADNIPVVNACIWTWVRLAAAPGEYEIIDDSSHPAADEAARHLRQMTRNLYATRTGNAVSLVSFLTDFLTCLFRDGLAGGFLTVKKDGSAVDRFVPVDPVDVREDLDSGRKKLLLETDNRTIDLNRPDFYYIPLSNGVSEPLGRSILQAVPFVTYIEQQLVNDMRRASHNAGFQRLHVKITPPERFAGESDSAYIDRINAYFDSTVNMIKSCEVDENPVTWDNVAVSSIGADGSRSSSSSWFVQHRAMVEEICAGTNLAPFLLGYSYGATTTWSNFKFDMVMRQVRSVQAEVSHLLEWIGNVELALAGYSLKCRFNFDNSFSYQALERATVESSQLDSILKLYQNGLLDRETASRKIRDLV